MMSFTPGRVDKLCEPTALAAGVARNSPKSGPVASAIGSNQMEDIL